jgi:hypothetical protein
MEHSYDIYDCTSLGGKAYSDCRFAFTLPKDAAKMPGWSIDWQVVVQPGMSVIASNHQRTRREGGVERLIWSFDGNLVSSANVDFTVRIPRAR